jgi:hypothetical protein
VAIAWQEVSIARVVHRRQAHARGAQEQDEACIEKIFLSNRKKAHGVYEIGLAA